MFRIGRRDYTTLGSPQKHGAQMPRRRAAPRLYLDPARQQWIIRDGASFIRTGCAEHERDGAEKRLATYLGQKHTPQRSSTPLIADILLAYSSEHLPHTASAKNASYGLPTSRHGGAIEL